MFRNPMAIALTVVLGILCMGTSAPAQDQDGWPRFEGIWDTDQGRMALWQAGDAVWGLYEGNGEIGGHIDDDGTLRFWYETGPEDTGDGWLSLNDDLVSFHGFFNSTMEASVHGSWEGTRLGPNPFEVSDRAALEWEPGQSPEVYIDEEEDAAVPPAVTPPEVTPSVEDQEIEDTEFAVDAGAAWTGTWDTGRGYLVLAAGDDLVYGSFGESGIFEGTVDGDTVSATWSATGEDRSTEEGEALFTVAEDGMSFRGAYNRSDEPDLWLPWLGSKVDNSVWTTLPVEQETGVEVPTVSPPEVVPPEPEVVEEDTEEDTESEDATGEEEESGEVIYELVLTATGECWVTFRAHDGRSYAGMMLDGDTLTFTDSTGFYIRAGAPENLEVELDGELVEWETGQTEMVLPPGADVPTD